MGDTVDLHFHNRAEGRAWRCLWEINPEGLEEFVGNLESIQFLYQPGLLAAVHPLSPVVPGFSIPVSHLFLTHYYKMWVGLVGQCSHTAVFQRHGHPVWAHVVTSPSWNPLPPARGTEKKIKLFLCHHELKGTYNFYLLLLVRIPQGAPSSLQQLGNLASLRTQGASLAGDTVSTLPRGWLPGSWGGRAAHTVWLLRRLAPCRMSALVTLSSREFPWCLCSKSHLVALYGLSLVRVGFAGHQGPLWLWYLHPLSMADPCTLLLILARLYKL